MATSPQKTSSSSKKMSMTAAMTFMPCHGHGHGSTAICPPQPNARAGLPPFGWLPPELCHPDLAVAHVGVVPGVGCKHPAQALQLGAVLNTEIAMVGKGSPQVHFNLLGVDGGFPILVLCSEPATPGDRGGGRNTGDRVTVSGWYPPSMHDFRGKGTY
jgi:hypothetical protein